MERRDSIQIIIETDFIGKGLGGIEWHGLRSTDMQNWMNCSMHSKRLGYRWGKTKKGLLNKGKNNAVQCARDFTVDSYFTMLHGMVIGRAKLSYVS